MGEEKNVMQTIFVIFVLTFAETWTQDLPSRCVETICSPTTGDLLIGRAKKLFASSTCGLRRPTRYCVLSHLHGNASCFNCDSRTPYGRNNHRVHNIIADFGKDWTKNWWQTENGVAAVYLQVDLEAEFQLTHLILKFKTFRPAAMLIERSSDFGRSWTVYRYFAKDCAESFPGVSVGPITKLDDVICESKYSDVVPSTGGEVIYPILPASVAIKDPYTEEIQDLLKVTNLRINFTSLHTLGDDLIGSDARVNANYYYALYGLVMRGSCSCYGHASHCIPVPGEEDHPGMIHGRCDCIHNTKGLNCELCDDFYNDLPWRPARRGSANACKKCECNGHTDLCHFDAAVYEATNRVSGGVCDECQHNTAGLHCRGCQPSFYQDPQLSLDNPNICRPCNCDPDGSLSGGVCHDLTDASLGVVAGQCSCKRHVRGLTCRLCESGFWNMRASNQEGCQHCDCNVYGSIRGGKECDQLTGQCQCKRYVTGRQCNRCVEGHWQFGGSPDGCVECNCNMGGALDERCSPADGQCHCHPNIVGITCNHPADGYFFPGIDHLLYEAELATPTGKAFVETRKPEEDTKPTWTGSGFMRVHQGDRLQFNIDDFPFTLNYYVVIRYELQSRLTWDNVKVSLMRPHPVDSGGLCGNVGSETETENTAIFEPGTTHYKTMTKFCLESGVSYKLSLQIPNYWFTSDKESFLVDSIVLVPDVASIPTLQVNPNAGPFFNDIRRLGCMEPPYLGLQSEMPQKCEEHIKTVSAAVHREPIACSCHPIGSSGDTCDPIGGQCSCKRNVMGRKCDQCTPGSWGLMSSGCKACECDADGSEDMFCSAETGQCNCLENVIGTKCDQCRKGEFGFPGCRHCQCGGRSEECDSFGRCIECRDNTEGDNCERCIQGHYEDPVAARGCRPCLCPGGPTDRVQHADSCALNPYANEITCNCNRGYAGIRCDRCEKNHYGRPLVVGGTCQRCQCNDNIDFDVANSCDADTGRCTKCLYKTAGFHCEQCQSGYYGDAVTEHICRKCNCNILGSNRSNLQCDQVTGQCPCLPNVIGLKCDECRPLHWKLASGRGCEPCSCDPSGSLFDQCNRFDGQCTCVPERGGRDCSQCPKFHWKGADRSGACVACNCDPRGSFDGNCDDVTGQCRCRPSVTGRTCDRCEERTSGSLPNCVPCGECLDNWHLDIQTLFSGLEVIKSNYSGIKDRILPRHDRELREIESFLNQTQMLFSTTSVHPDLNRARQSLRTLRINYAAAGEKLNETDLRLQKTGERLEDVHLRIETISDLEALIKTKGKRLHQNATSLGGLSVTGAYESMTLYRSMSTRAENITKSSSNTLLDSEVKRNQVDDVFDEFNTDYNSNTDKNRAALNEASHAVDQMALQIPTFNHLVCGRQTSQCDSNCGGGGCGRCGGQVTCLEGSVTSSEEAHSFSLSANALFQSKMKNTSETLEQVYDVREECLFGSQKANIAFVTVEIIRNATLEQNSHVRLFLEFLLRLPNESSSAVEETVRFVKDTLQCNISLTPANLTGFTKNITRALRGAKGIRKILKATHKKRITASELYRSASNAKKSADNVMNQVVTTIEYLTSAHLSNNMSSTLISEMRIQIDDLETEIMTVENFPSYNQRFANATEYLRNAKIRLHNIAMSHNRTTAVVDVVNAKIKAATALTSELTTKQNKLKTEERNLARQLDKRYRDAVLGKARADILLRRTNRLSERLRGTIELQAKLHNTERAFLTIGSELNRLNSEMALLLFDIRKIAQFHAQTC